MSAYLVDRSLFASVAAFLCEHLSEVNGEASLFVYSAETAPYRDNYRTPVQIANLLQEENLASLRSLYRDGEFNATPITEAEVDAAAVPTPGQMYGIMRKIDYQSCERPDYGTSLAREANAKVVAFALQVVAYAEKKAAGITDPTGTLYAWT